MNECALSIIWQYGERSVRVVVPESLIMMGDTFLRTLDRDHDAHSPAGAVPVPSHVALDKQPLDKRPLSDPLLRHGVHDLLPTITPLGSILSKYIGYMNTRRTRHGFMADLSYLRGIFGPICAELKRKRMTTPRRKSNSSKDLLEPHIESTCLEEIMTS